MIGHAKYNGQTHEIEVDHVLGIEINHNGLEDFDEVIVLDEEGLPIPEPDEADLDDYVD